MMMLWYRVEVPKNQTKKTVVSWTIQVEWSDGTIENLNDLPNGVAHEVDEWLTELENEKKWASSAKLQAPDPEGIRKF